jgi:hypothetical protein
LGFDNMAEMRAPRKAIIFTESQAHPGVPAPLPHRQRLCRQAGVVQRHQHHEESTRIYQAGWSQQGHGPHHRLAAGGSPHRLIDHFRKDDGKGADIMIATEAGAEGINLQFCALIINYDLPWNPQRVEQRIGRCHRYGQRYDVVVINFLNTRNQADQRVLELLTEKFNLFSGVFGASDEVLGRIESGIDFEKRILQIYDTCRQPEDIEAAFNALQAELEEDIAAVSATPRPSCWRHFDEDVHDRLKLRLDEAEARLDKMGRWFWGVTRYALDGRARFDEQPTPSRWPTPDPMRHGRYQLMRGAAQPTCWPMPTG